MYDIFENSYEGIQTKFLNSKLRFFKKGDLIPLEESQLPKTYIVAVEFYDKDDFIYLLFKNNKYINNFYKLKDIKDYKKIPFYCFFYFICYN